VVGGLIFREGQDGSRASELGLRGEKTNIRWREKKYP